MTPEQILSLINSQGFSIEELDRIIDPLIEGRDAQAMKESEKSMRDEQDTRGYESTQSGEQIPL